MKPSKNLPVQIKVGARSSKLSIAQVHEIERELQKAKIFVEFVSTYLKTKGDLDQETSLKLLDKTDFFTKEIDDLVISKKVDIAIHSAKDLPDPLHRDLRIIAITKGQDPSDSLVMDPSYSILTLPKSAKIGTSSLRREENLKAMRSDFCFVDIRGTIEERLQLFHQKKIDALVIAEAALLRLGFTKLYREKIPGIVAENQGKLAIVAHKDNLSLAKLFGAIDSREKICS